ncbi:MFS transporter [Candidatus Entotheonella palauensis]|uniref:MFS transporter n=1 Tax=Candidatus Entotheonella palauensis TaxID=93172 RepID=UPI0015C4DC5B|nr:MFS transporter [Candidatus Entotheonella palauensis]
MKPQRAPILNVLRDADFRMIWCVGGLSEVARWMEQLVLSLLIWEVTRSPFQLALVLVFNNAPRPLCGPFTGLLADRFSRRRVLFGAQCLATSTAMGLLFTLISGTIQPWHVYLAVALMGITKALEDPSRRTAILDIVGPQRLVNALSLDGMNHTIGKVLGPLTGGTLVEAVGYTGACGCILAIHVINLGLVTRLRIPPSQGVQQGDSIWRSLVMAVRVARHSPLVLGMLYVTVVMNALAFPTRQFIPAIGSEYLGVGAGLVGLLAAAEGFGQLIASSMLANTRNLRHHGRVFVAGSALVLLIAVLFVWAPWYVLAFALLAIGGCGQAGFSTMQSTITMLGAPPAMRSRMMGLLSVCIGLSTPLGTLEIGLVAAAFTIPAAITVNALAGLLLLWPAVTLTPLVRRSATSPPSVH